MSTEALVALIIALLTAISLIVSTVYLVKNLKQETRLRTLEYATAEFNRLEELGSRDLVRRLKEKTVLDYLNTLPEPQREEMRRRALQTVHVFNRIGAGIYKNVFARDVVFELWTPKWIEWLAQQVKVSKVKTEYQQPLVPTTAPPATSHSRQIANSTVAMGAGIASLVLAVRFIVPDQWFYGVIFAVAGIVAVIYAWLNWRRIP